MTWSYHPDGSLATRNDAAASSATVVDQERSFEYSYDADGRTVRVDDTTPGGALVDTFETTYDDVGRVERVEERDGTAVRRTTTYGYDVYGNTTSVLASRGERVGTGDEGNLAASRFTGYTWDERDLVKTVTAGDSPVDADLRTWAYTYDPRGMKASWTKPDASGAAAGNVTTYAYHESGLLRRMVERNPRLPDNPLVASHQLWFNPDGDRTRDVSRVDDADTSGYLDQTATYTYTPERKLAEVAKSGTNKSKDETYLYDDAGNVDEQTVEGTTTDFVYDKNRLIEATASKPGATSTTSTYHYDPFGRLDHVTAAGQIVEDYSYDGFDRVIEETKSYPGQAQVVKNTSYDPFDRALLQIKTIGTQAPTKTRFNYLGMTEQVAVEERQDSTGAWQVDKTYNYGPDGRPLVLEDTPVTGTAPDRTHLYGVNPHGDTETLTDPVTGETTATYRYTAYGSTDKTGTTGLDKLEDDPVKDEDVVNPYRFNSKRFDGATAKYDMGFRNYDPALNRFLTRDMYNGALNDLALGTDPWHTNRYAFAGGNPITGVELDGHYVTVGDGAGGGSGGGSGGGGGGGGGADGDGSAPPSEETGPPTEDEIRESFFELYDAHLPEDVAQDMKEQDLSYADDPEKLANHRRWFLALEANKPEESCAHAWWCSTLANPITQEVVSTAGGLTGVIRALVLARRAALSATAAKGAAPRFIGNSAGDILDTTRITIPEGKFGYLLKNPSKSGVFKDSMGFDQAGLDSALRNHLTTNFGNASTSVPMTGGGTKFVVRGPLTGPSGQTWNITSAWGVDVDGTIRLITARP